MQPHALGEISTIRLSSTKQNHISSLTVASLPRHTNLTTPIDLNYFSMMRYKLFFVRKIMELSTNAAVA